VSKKHFLVIFLFVAFLFSLVPQTNALSSEKIKLGVWVTVFAPQKILYSQENADRMIEICRKSGINQIYLQIYRANKAYYDSNIADRKPFETMKASAGCDMVQYIIEQAKKNDIEVHAWINLLSLAQNENAKILKKYGKSILTLDQNGNPSSITGKAPDDFIREGQIFLEPGDWRVKEYLLDITEEITRKYPALAGLHLDYIRYPVAVPFAPGSRFNNPAISYGYSNVNIKKCIKLTGLDIKKATPSRETYQKWDDWRRSQVTGLVQAISINTRDLAPSIQISCAVCPSVERAYMITLQDWPKWISENLVDYVVTMNYSDDTRLMTLNARSGLLPELKDKVYIGIGAYLLKKKPEVIEDQLNILYGLKPGGIVIFSYDEVADISGLRSFLASTTTSRDRQLSSNDS